MSNEDDRLAQCQEIQRILVREDYRLPDATRENPPDEMTAVEVTRWPDQSYGARFSGEEWVFRATRDEAITALHARAMSRVADLADKMNHNARAARSKADALRLQAEHEVGRAHEWEIRAWEIRELTKPAR